MSDLLPCPFCGACLDYAAPVTYFHPIGKCILSGRNFKKGVIGQWNRRIEDAPDARAEVLKEAVKACKAVADELREDNDAEAVGALECALRLTAMIGSAETDNLGWNELPENWEG